MRTPLTIASLAVYPHTGDQHGRGLGVVELAALFCGAGVPLASPRGHAVGCLPHTPAGVSRGRVLWGHQRVVSVGVCHAARLPAGRRRTRPLALQKSRSSLKRDTRDRCQCVVVGAACGCGPGVRRAAAVHGPFCQRRLRGEPRDATRRAPVADLVQPRNHCRSCFGYARPAADRSSQAAGIQHAKVALLFASVAGAAGLQHVHNLSQYTWPLASSTAGSNVTGAAFASTNADAGAGLFASGWANACQASISWDAVLSGGACLAYIAANASRNNNAAGSSASPISAWPFLLAAPLVSPAAAFAAFLACEAAQRALGQGGTTRRKVKL